MTKTEIKKANQIYEDVKAAIQKVYGEDFTVNLQKRDDRDFNQFTICTELYYEEFESIIDNHLGYDMESKHNAILEAECGGRWVICIW